MSLILGIDEAGRGPVIGPMVMCGYLIREKSVTKLKKLGVTDSKLLSKKQREFLFSHVKKLADDMIVFHIPAAEIDRLRTVSNLNKLEIERMRQMIELLEPDKVIIDAPEANVANFKKKISSGLKAKSVIAAENFADKNYIEVAAASVIAKVSRDREIETLHKKYGYFGSGYPSDSATIGFLKNWIKENKEFPDFVRKSWITAQLIMEEKEQTKIGKFVRDEMLAED
ncbi:MAG: ribonuclease HII [Candidatus Aenigmarchaeota archaeon]|nr:ribonuclease HII [Candidatus Aenigmarchaeota archaeon]